MVFFIMALPLSDDSLKDGGGVYHVGSSPTLATLFIVN